MQWQLPMQRVLYAVAPSALAAVYFFGWRALAVLLVTLGAAFLTEFLFARSLKIPVTSSVLVTGALLALSLPPTIPYWMAAVGAAVGVTFGKMVFGGFGKNLFNPALVGRAFLYVSFGNELSARWIEPVNGAAGGFAAYTSDAVSGATPMAVLARGETVDWLRPLLGNTAGSLGETSALLLILGGLYITWKKAANYRIVVSGFAGFLLMQTVLWLLDAQASGPEQKLAADPLSALLSGGLVFGIFFFATEPVGASQTGEGKWIYGGLIGVLTALIRLFSSWPEGMMFAVLLGNVFAPIMDVAIRELKRQSGKAAPHA